MFVNVNSTFHVEVRNRTIKLLLTFKKEKNFSMIFQMFSLIDSLPEEYCFLFCKLKSENFRYDFINYSSFEHPLYLSASHK